ncbi:unnamed protein product [Prunus armeniaca]
MAPRDQPLALLLDQPAVLPYIPRRMDPNPFPLLARGRRGRRGINPTMTGIDRGQTRGIIQISKRRKSIGRKFCPDHTEWNKGLDTTSQSRDEIFILSML